MQKLSDVEVKLRIEKILTLCDELLKMDLSSNKEDLRKMGNYPSFDYVYKTAKATLFVGVSLKHFLIQTGLMSALTQTEKQKLKRLSKFITEEKVIKAITANDLDTLSKRRGFGRNTMLRILTTYNKQKRGALRT